MSTPMTKGLLTLLTAVACVVSACVEFRQGAGRPATRAADCFTITVTNTPLQPAPGATLCLPINVPR